MATTKKRKLLPKGLLFSDIDETNTETGFATDKADEAANAIYYHMTTTGIPGDVFYDAEGMSKEYGFDRDAYHKNTPQSIADMLNTNADIITKALNRPDCKPDDPETFYYNELRGLKLCRKHAKNLGVDLPDLPMLTGFDYKRGMIDLVEWCEDAVAILTTTDNGGKDTTVYKYDPQEKGEQSKKQPKKIVQKSKYTHEKIKKKGRESLKDEEMPSNYIPCTEITGIIRRRSDSIARSLRAAKYPVIKKANKNYCNPEHAAVLFPKWKKHLKKQQENK